MPNIFQSGIFSWHYTFYTLGCSLHCTFEITWRLAGSADVSSASEAWESIIRLASRQAGVHVDKIDWFRTDFVNWSVFCAIVMINENYFAANGCSLLFFDRQARRLSDERYGKYHADETSALPGGLSVILSNSGFFVPFYVESRLHPLFLLLPAISQDWKTESGRDDLTGVF